MRRIFPAKSSSNDGAPVKHPVKRERSDPGSKRENFKQRTQESSRPPSVKQISAQERTKREHWCPSCPSGAERCDTPPSGDENLSITRINSCQTQAESEKQEVISQYKLGLPEECQDKQILRPSINAMSRSPSLEAFQWTSGLQAALDQLVGESRQELRRKYISEPPSPTSSPPLLENDKADGRPATASSLDDQQNSDGEVSSGGRLSHPEDSDSTTMANSMDFGSRTSSGPKLTRSLSRSFYGGASILSNPRSHSFSDWSRGTKTADNFSQEESGDSGSRDRSHFKYLSARAVAERLAKAIRGNSKTKDARRLPPIPHTPTRSSSESTASYSTNSKVARSLTQATESSRVSHPGFGNNRLAPKIQVEKTRGNMEIERRVKVEVQQKQENDFFRRQLESHSSQISFVYDNLSERVCAAEGLLAAAEAEVKSSNALQGDKHAAKLSNRELERHDVLQRRLKKLQKEKNELAREVVSEVRLRDMERSTVREVVEFMKRDMEFWIKSLERDKSEMRNRLEHLEKRTNESWLTEKVQKLSEEKNWLERELVTVTTKESALRQKVREFELQMQAHVTRVEDAERTILELRESAVSAQKKMMQLEEEDEQLRRAYKDKETENTDLRKLVGRLQQLCSDHEKSIRGLWESLRSLSHDKSDQKVAKLQHELLRLSDTEQVLRRELETLRVEASGLKHELAKCNEPEADRLKAQISTLQECVNVLSIKLKDSLEHQRKQQKEISALESLRTNLEKQNEDLHAKLKKDSEQQVGDNEPIFERGQNGKQQIIDGLQQSLSDMTHALNTQNSRIQRLTGRNEELFRLYNAKEKELLDLQTKAREDNENKKAKEEELKQVKEKLKCIQDELQVQQLHCNVLKEKVAGKEMELEQCKGEAADSAQGRGMLQDEVVRLRRQLQNATERMSELEHELKDREQKLGLIRADMKQCLQELGRYREEMPKVIRQRDGMKQEAEQLGREALRMSAEAEILKRRVHELEEEVMLRDGHLSILRGSLNNNDDEC